jgi:predicted ATPase
VTLDDRALLKQAYQEVADEPLEPGEARYVDLTAARGGEDPVLLMARTIALSPRQSVQLFSGFPGTGKTTELKRLRRALAHQGHDVVLVDAEEYLSTSKPIDVPEILLALVDATMNAHFDTEPPTPAVWSELVSYCWESSVAERLKAEPTVWQHLAKSRTRRDLVEEVHAFFAKWSKKRGASNDPSELVIIMDSLDHFRSASLDGATAGPIDAIFTRAADEIALPGVHLVLTVPPSVRLRASSAGVSSRWGAVTTIPAVSVRGAGGKLQSGSLDALRSVVAKRVDVARLFADVAHLDRWILASGGNLRDLLRLVREGVRSAGGAPLDPGAIDAAIERIRAEFPPLDEPDVTRLAQIAETHRLVLDAAAMSRDFVRWVDAHLIQQYRNGRHWYDVHPLIRDAVLQQARELVLREDVVAYGADPPPPRAKLPRAPQPTDRVALTPDMRVTFAVESYRALRRVRWTLPRGVSALVGPNGSGKTTLLDVPELLRHALTHDVRKAIDDRGGPGTLRSVDADSDAPVVLGAELDALAWQLDLSPKGAAFNPLHGERATVAGVVAFDRASTDLPTDDARPILRRFADLEQGAALRPLVALLEGYRLYGTYDLASIRVNGSQVSSDEHLHPDGRNVFSALRNWRDRKETRPRWDFVIESLRAAFPDTFEDLDFDMAGQTVSGRIVAPKPDVRIPTYFAANGWLVALLHLAAVASTQPAGAVAIDEVENGLHPFAIRALIEAMRGWAGRTGISIVLATHSPVVIDQFKEAPDHLFVMEPGRETTPVRLDELHDPDWLAHFSLGDLYAHDEFGAQHKDGQRVA